MSYVLARAGAVVTWPYSFAQLRRDNPAISFPGNIIDQRLADYDVFPVQPTAPPAVPIEKDLREVAPTFNGAAWLQAWQLVDASPEAVADRIERAAQADEFDAAKLDAWILAFLDMTPDEARQYVLDNSATLAALRTNVARIAYAVRVLVRREFHV